jgi:formylmethanofuran dehydrogenase subunit D
VGGGGGGRVSIDDTMTYSNFTGPIKADTSDGGGPGTVYLPAAARTNFVVVSNQTIVLGAGTEYQFGTLVVSGTVDCGAFLAGAGTGCVIRATNLTVASGGKIRADGRGWPTRTGPGGSSLANAGATHGGKGWNNASNLYGSVTNPTAPGSGSYNVTGGGAFALRVSGILQLNGALQANGTADASGGGSGGSIWITGGGTLTGTGTISADGGTLYSGGGRISIDDTMTYSNFTGNLKADVTEGGGPGTIYLPAAARSNFVVVSNQTIVLGAGTEYQFGTLVVSGTVDCGAFLAGEGTGCVIHATSLTVASGGRIKADNRGWPTQRGPAPGGSGVGASHGGKGANNTNALYGNPLNPLNCGSAGIRRRRAAARSISMSAAARCGLTAS